MINTSKKKIDVASLEKSGWIVEVGKKGEKKKKGALQTTFLDIKEE